MRGSRLFLYGPPGAGKSRVGEVLARTLGWEFIDLDAEIERDEGRTVAEIFETSGEGAFREMEGRALRRVREREGSIVALGGGALLSSTNRDVAEAAGPVVVLEAPGEVLVRRLSRATPIRPLLAGGAARLADLLAARREHYRSFGLRVDAAGNDPEAVARAVQAAAGRFRISGMGAPYPVVVERGVAAEAGERLREAGGGSPVAVVADDNTGPLYGAAVERSLRDAGFETSLVQIPAGEAGKSLETVEGLWNGFLDGGLERGSAVLAVGGGVVTDLAGFAAATFLRGIAWAAIPTSLLAMVDAAMGGKTGANLARGKNLVGAFHPPRFVLSDPGTLDTLPADELRQGLAEVFKHGLIDDPALFELCEQGLEEVERSLERVVRRAVAVKVRVVEEDPFERGRRAALNLGHTVGHAVERVSGYQVRHGDAVALGLVAEARIAEEMGLCRTPGLAGRILEAVRRLGLADRLPAGASPELLSDAMQVDKKRAGGRVRFALPVAIGEVRTGVEVDPALLRKVLRR